MHTYTSTQTLSYPYTVDDEDNSALYVSSVTISGGTTRRKTFDPHLSVDKLKNDMLLII